MGNIANKIDATDKKLSEILSGERYRVDSFQREYRWQRKHIEALISDLSISFLNSYQLGDTIENSISYDCYYMGPVVLCKDGNELSIVDGQQRLTSFTLLIIFLYHKQKGIETDFELRDLRDHLYVRKAGKKTLILNVETRNNVIEHLLNDPEEIFYGFEDIEYPDESVTNILSRYEDINALFPEELKSNGVLPLFIEWILERVILIEVKAYSMENAYTIFETMNDRGMTLSPTEILKGFLLSKISDDNKSAEANDFWKNRITKLNKETKLDADLDFFRAWLRAKYAITSRSTKVGAENEDFELIATQFNSWVKNNTKKVHLKESNDYYFFIISDFDFYSDLYIKLYEFKNYNISGYKDLYINSFYPIADSLYYPLLLSSVSKIDDENIIHEKILLVNKFIDIYTNYRVLSNKSITQSSIRYYIYDLIKDLRNNDLNDLVETLKNRVSDIYLKEDGYVQLHFMNNWGYYHYFFARLINHLTNEDDFNQLIRNRKQSSYVLLRIFEFDDMPSEFDEIFWNSHIHSVAGHCLVRRWDLDKINSKRSLNRLKYLIKQGYLPEMNEYEITTEINFINDRDQILNTLVNQVWNFR